MSALIGRLGLGAAVVAVGLALGLVATINADDLWALTIVLVLMGIVVLRLRRRTDQTWAASEWPHVVSLAGAARLFAGCAHLYVAYVVFASQVDFVGLQSWMQQAMDSLLRGEIRNLGFSRVTFVESTAVTYLMLPFFLVFGSSVIGMVFFSTVLGFLGSFLFLRAFQLAGPARGDVRFFGLTMLFLPSFVFWGTLFGKDSIVFLCLGGIAYAVARIVRRELSLGVVVGGLIALAILTAIRSHIGLAASLAVGAAWVARAVALQGAARVLSPVWVTARLVFVAVIATGPALLMFSLHGGVDFLLQQLILQHQNLSTMVLEVGDGGGSSLPPRIHEGTLTEFLAFIPEGFLTALYRPLPFDVHNIQAAVAAVEGTFVLVLTLMRWRQIVQGIREARSNPFMLFCLIYFLVGTWLMSMQRNLGVVVRQRTMIWPFLIIFLATFPRQRAATTARPIDHDDAVVAEPRA